MKTYKNVWDEFISMENLLVAAKKAVKSKKNKKQTKRFLAHQERMLLQLQQVLKRGHFKTSGYNVFTVYEPKQRLIYELPLYPDHIVHHAIINVLGRYWQNSFVRDSYACIPGRGIHSASRQTVRFVKRNKYVLQCDIKKFYPSVNHDIVMDILKRKIKDRRMLNLLHNIVYSMPGGTNLPIGNLTSQWLGNVYMNQLDMFVKHVLHCRDYVRYSDDFCLFANDKQVLREYAKKVSDFIENKLKLRFSKCVLRPTVLGVSFIGYRHFADFVLLRRRAVVRIKKRILNIAKNRDRSKLVMFQLASTKGFLSHANVYNFKRWLLKQVSRCGNSVMTEFIKRRIL